MPITYYLDSAIDSSDKEKVTAEAWSALTGNERTLALSKAVSRFSMFTHLTTRPLSDGELDPSLHGFDDAIFLQAATNGHIQVVNKLLELTRDVSIFRKMIHADKDKIFDYGIPSAAPHILSKVITKKGREHSFKDGIAILQYPEAAIFLAVVLPSECLPTFDRNSQEIISKLQHLKYILKDCYRRKGMDETYEPNRLLSKLFDGKFTGVPRFQLLKELIDTSDKGEAWRAEVDLTIGTQKDDFISSLSLGEEELDILREAMVLFLNQLCVKSYEVEEDVEAYGCCFR